MQTPIAFIVVFGTIVFFHELGHFLVAKLAGVTVFEFALGFGPAILKKKIGPTTYAIRIIPLGGFVKLAGMDEPEDIRDDVDVEDPGNFNNKSLFVRMAIIAAGPLMNFVFAAIVLTLSAMLIVIPPTILYVEPEFPAHESGLRPGDQVVAIDQQPVKTTEQVVSLIKNSAGKTITLQVEREKESIDIQITPQGEAGEGIIGVHIQDKQRQPFFQSLATGVLHTWELTKTLVIALKEMVFGQMKLELSGPIGIYQHVGEFAKEGIGSLMYLLAVLNVNLGLLNLLPIPVLDGGWLVLFAYEAVRGRPVKPEHRGIAQFIGLVLLLFLMIFATYKDIARLNLFS